MFSCFASPENPLLITKSVCYTLWKSLMSILAGVHKDQTSQTWMGKSFFCSLQEAGENLAWAQRNSWGKYWITNHILSCSSPDSLGGMDLPVVSRQSFVLRLQVEQDSCP